MHHVMHFAIAAKTFALLSLSALRQFVGQKLYTTMEDSKQAVRIKATYWIAEEAADHDESSNDNDASNRPTMIRSFGPASPMIDDDTHIIVDTPSRMGLPEGVAPVKLPAGDDTYSGLHDQGPLPPLLEGGPMAVLLSCLQTAKKFNDDYLTQVMEDSKTKKAEKKITHSVSSTKSDVSDEAAGLPLKRAKVNGGDADES